MLVEYPARLYIVAGLLLLIGFGAGTGSQALAFVAAAVAVMLLPGLFTRQSFVSSEEEDEEREPAEPVVLPDDTIGLEVLEDAALVVTTEHDVVAANSAARELLGTVPAEDVRLAIRHPVALEAVDIAISERSEVVRELDSFAAAGRTYRLRIAPIDEHRLLMNFVDYSQVRATERMRADFVANASHELRTPLATVSGFIETLQGAAADDEAARTRFLGLMNEETSRMTRLIDDLLSLSRVELDKSMRPRTRTDLLALVDEFSETVELEADAGGHEFIVDAEANLPPVLADRDQIFQVLRNLVSNAFKYGGSGSPVTLSLRRAENSVLVSVRDEGEGILPEHIPRLTERFYRVDAGRSRRLGGTGLGLAIVKHIVERHRGKLEIRSEPGVGTVVSFTIPLAGPLSGEAGGALPALPEDLRAI
ncbi:MULTISPECIES: ATP-binding protein [Pacificimonas]|nr:MULTISPECIES: ATP-binding protein [Pacificimonas]MBZ6378775.1 ATPase [Pacificimonas aurantium]